MLKNLKISTKIALIAFVGIIGLLIVAIVTVSGLNKIGAELEEIAEYQVPLNTVITELEKDILLEEVLTYQLVIASKDVNSKKFKDLEQEILKLEHETEKTIKKAEKYAKKAIDHNNDPNIKKEYQYILNSLIVIEKEQKRFEKHLKQFEHDIKTGHLEHFDAEVETLHHDLKDMEKHIVSLMHKMEELLEHSTHQAEHDEIILLNSVIVVLVLVLLISSLLSFILIKGIQKSLKDFQNGVLSFFQFLNRESTNVIHLDDSSSDEIGIMSKVINENINITKKGIEEDRKVIDESIKVLSEFEQGDLCQRVSLTTTNPALQELITLLNQMGANIETNIDGALNVLEEYSNNSYLKKVDTKGIKEHLLKLANGVNTLGDSITNLLLKSLQDGLTLQNNASLLSANVEKLSTSSNQQAASLEETAAALEEITSTITSNSENVSQMTSYANSLSNAIQDGESLANRTSRSMDEIDEQVNAINEAITVIDQIAFQTNILSLNAAVEAATAGEAGKGFAVVAQEVRNLASRSAEAAKEIKDMVESATDKANEGKKISDDMIKGYGNLNDIISNTVDLINQVSSASKEQQSGLEQINLAVSELDKATQENANVASQTDEISRKTNDMATELVEETKKSEFIGKNNGKVA